MAEVLESWRETFPTEEAFERRLDRDGLTEADCRHAVAAARLAEDEPLPAWVERLDEVVAAVVDSEPGDQPEWVAPEPGEEPERERRFGPLSAAIASHARDRLPDDPVRDALSAGAVGSMAEWLRTRFERRFTRVLYVEFKAFVAAHDRELAFADPAAFDDRVTRGITRAVEGFPEEGLGEVDHLCCGDAGRAEFLLEGEARALLGGVLARKRDAGYYRTLSFTREVPNPTFFHGVSGVGYAMLRVADPGLPCALLWERPVRDRPARTNIILLFYRKI